MLKLSNKTTLSYWLMRKALTGFKVVLFMVALTGVFLYTRAGAPERAEALTPMTLNFQARLLQGSGAIVADGKYNVEFKLYDAASGGNLAWTETRIDANGAAAGSDARVEVRSGYLSVYLGDVNAFGSINWDQQLYLTMNIGGQSQTSPSWDGEMNPRLRLTSVPYAVQAQRAEQLAKQVSGFSAQLLFPNTLGQNTNYLLPDPGVGSATICLTTGNCSGSGSGVTASTPGAAGRVALFTGGQDITSSVLYQDDTNDVLEVDTNYDLSLLGGNLSVVGDVSVVGNSSFTGFIDIPASTAPGLSPGTTGRMYFDAADNVIKLSQDGGVFYDICTTGGNCAGSGSGVTSSGTTAGYIPVLTGTQQLGNSMLFQDDTADALEVAATYDLVVEGGDLVVTGGGSFTANVTFGGGVTINNNSSFSQTGTGTFSTGTGAVDLNGATSVTGSNTFTVGTGATQLGGTLNVSGAATLQSTLAVQGASVTIGSASQTGSLTMNDGNGGQTASITPANLTQNTNFSLPDVNFATAEFCVRYSTGSSNCAGLGNAVDSLNGLQGPVNLNGTANEIVITDNGTNTITIGLPDDVTIGDDLTVTDALSSASLAVSANATVGGTLDVTGASTFTALGTFNGGLTVAGTTAINTTGTAATNIGNANSATTVLGTVGINNSGTGTTTIGNSGAALTLQGSSLIINTATISRTAAGTTTLDLVDTANTTFALANSGAGVANFTIDGAITAAGLITTNSGVAITNNGTFSQTGTGTFSTGTGLVSLNGSSVQVSSLSAGGLVKADATTGALSVAVAGTDYEVALTFDNGLTRTGNAVSLGGNLTAGTSIGLNGNSLTFDGSTGDIVIASTGAATFSAGITLDNNASFSQTGTGTFSTGTGAVDLNGATNVTGTNTFTVGTGLTTLGGGLTATGTTNINATGSAATVIGNTNATLSLNGSSIVLGTASVTRTAAGATSLDFIDAADTTLAITNSGAGNVNLTVDGSGTFANGLTVTTGGATLTGNSTITGTLTGLTGLTSSGTITFSGLSTDGVVTVTGGVLGSSTTLSVANGGTGAATLTANGILFGNGTGAVQVTGAAANSILVTDGSNVPSLSQTLPTAVQGNITQTGALDAGSITANFGSIDVGADAISTTGTVSAGTLSVSGDATIGGNLTVTGTSDFTGLATFNGGLSVAAGEQLTNAGSTLFTAVSITDKPTGGSIGTAATTVDIATTFNVDQDTASQTLTLPTPTDTTAGRVIYVNNVGSSNFSMGGVLISTGRSQGFIWTGTAWTGAGIDSAGDGVTQMGAIDSQTKSANGAVISNNTLYLQTADGTSPGLVSTGAQTFAGSKTFSAQIVANGGINLGTQTLQGSTAVIDFSNFDVDASGNLDAAGTLTAGTGNAFQVAANGAVTAVGINAGTGLLQGTGGLTLTGTTLINTTGTANTTIGNATGTLTVTGSSASTFVIDGATISAAEFTLLDGRDAALVDINDTVNTAITGVGVLTSGSIASGFGTISTANNITTTATLTGGTLSVTSNATIGGDIVVSGGNITLGASGQAGTVSLYDGQTGASANTLTFDVVGTLGQNTTITFGDPGAGGTATVCYQNSASCGFALATGNNYVFFAPGTAQVDTAAESSIYINDTGGGNLIQLQSGGNDQFVVANNGDTTVNGNTTINGNLSATGTVTFSGLTADRLVATTTGGQLTNSITAANLASSVTGTTGTGDLVFSASPTFTGTVSVAALNASGNVDIDGSLTLGSSGQLVVDASGNLDTTGTIEGSIINATTGFRVNGAATTGNYLRGDGTNFVSSALMASDLSGTIFSSGADTGTGTFVTGDTISVQGGTNGIDTSLSGDTFTINLDTTEIGTTTFGAGSGFTWTFDAGATDPSFAFASDALTVTAATTTLTGDLAVNGGDLTSATSLNVTASNGALTMTSTGAGNDVVINSADTIELQDNTNITGALGVSNGLTVSAGGASISGNTTIATTAGNTLGLGNATGALTVTGSSASTFVINGVTITASEFNLLDGKDAALVDVNDAVNTAITGTGALDSGSITSGFGSIDTGADNIQTTGTVQGGIVNATTGFRVNGSATAGNYLRGDGTNFVSSALQAGDISGTIFSTSGDTGTGTLTTGETISIQGGTNGIDVALSGDTFTVNLDTTEIGTTTFGSGSAFTWTFDAGAVDPQIGFASDQITLTATNTNLSGNLTIGDASTDSLTINGTAVSIPNNLNFDNGTLFIDAANNRIGIGTTTPGYQLHVVGADGQSATARVQSYDGVPIFGATRANGTAASPTALLDGDNFGQFGGEGYDGSAFTGTQAALIFSATQDWTTTAQGSEINFFTTANDTTNIVQRAVISNSGNFGLGTLSPTATFGATGRVLQVENTAGVAEIKAVASAGNAAIFSLQVAGATTDWHFENSAGTYRIVETGVATRFSITPGGNVGIGTTGNPAALLSVGGTTGNFQVAGTGAVTAVGVNSGTGLLQGTGGLTVTGAANINSTGTANTVIGNATGTFQVTSSGFNVTTAGAVTGVTTLNTSGIVTVGALGTADTDAVVCRNAAGQLAACNSTFVTEADLDIDDVFLQGGNSFGAVAVLGTDDAFNLELQTAGVTRLTLDQSGNATLTGNLTVQGTGTSSFAGDLAVNGGDISSTTSLNVTASNGALTLTSTGAGNDIVINSADTIELQDNTNITGSLGISNGLTVSAGGASIAGNTTIATTAGNTLSLGNATGALTVTGNSGSIFVINGVTISASEFNLLDGKDAALVDVNDAVNTAITGTGALNSGSITSGFGSIDTGADNIQTTGTVQGGIVNATTGFRVNGAAATGNYLRGDGTNFISSALMASDLSGTIFSTSADSNAGTNTVVSGDTLSIQGGTNGIDTSLNNDTYTINLDTTEIGTTTFGAGAGFTWTFNAGATDPTIAFASDALTVTAANTTLSGDLAVDGGDITSTTALSVTAANGALTLTSTGAGNDVVINSADTIELQDNTNVTGSLNVSNGLTVSAGGASISGNTTIATTAGNTLGLGNATGTLTVTGSSASTFVINGVTITAAEFNLLDGKDAALVDVNDAVNTAITGTGALDSGSITSGFGSIDTGADNIQTTGTVQGGIVNATTGFRVNGSATTGNYLRGDGTNFVSSALQASDINGTIFSTSGDTGTGTLTTGETIAVQGGTNGIDTVLSGDTWTLNLDTTEINDATFGNNSDTAIVWGFDPSGATNPTLSFADDSITLTASVVTLSGDLRINGNDIQDSAGTTRITLGATNTVTGNLTVTGDTSLEGNLTIGNASTDTVTINSSTFTFVNDTNFALSGGVNGLSIDGTTFSVDATNNRVGFGTLAPGYQLDLRSGGSASQLHFSADGTDSGGYLTSAAEDNFFFSGGAAWNGSAWVAKSTQASLLGALSGALQFYTNSGLTAGSTYSPTLRMSITQAGNIGINDATPDARLEVISTAEQLRLTHTDNTVDSRFTVDASGNLTIDNTGTKTVVADDLQVTGNDLLDSSGTSRVNLGATVGINGNLDASGNLEGTILNATTGFRINGGATTGEYLRGDGTNFVSSALLASDLSGTIFSTGADSGTGTLTTGETINIQGGTNGIDTSLSGDTFTLNLDTSEIGTTTFGSGAGFTWTFNAGATDPTIAFASNVLTVTTGNIDLIGSIRLGSASTGLAVETTGEISDLDGNIILDDQVSVGSATTGLLITTDGVISDIDDAAVTINDNLSVTGTATIVSTSSGAFVVQNSGATETLLSVDSTARGVSGGNLVKIGNSTGTDTGTTILQLDSATADITSNVSALNGGLYYYNNGASSEVRAIVNGSVVTVCDSSGNCAGAGTTLQTAYNNSIASPEIKLDTTRGGLTIQDADTTLGANTNLFELLSANAASTLFRVQGDGDVLTAGDFAVNGGDITSTGPLNITPGGALTVGATTQTITIQGTATSITSNGAGNDITVTSADQIILNSVGSIELQDNTNVTGNVDVSGTFTSGTGDAFQVDASGNVVTSGDAAINGGDITSTGALNITPGGALTVGATGQTATLQGAITTISSNGAGNDIILSSADAIELQGATNITGSLTVSVNADIAGTLFVGTGDAFQVDASGNVVTSGDAAINGGDITSTGALNITPGGALTVGATGQTALMQGSTVSITSNGAGNDVTVTSADQIILNAVGTIELQDNTNITGNFAVSGNSDVAGYLYVGSADQFQVDASGNTQTSGTLQVDGLATFSGGVTIDNDSSFSQTGTGTFSTGTGNVSFNGNTEVTGSNNFTVGSGQTTLGGDLAVNGGDITSSGALNITPGGALTVGVTTQTAAIQGSSVSVTSTGAGNDITVTSADQFIVNAGSSIELQDNTNISGNLDISGSLSVGTSDQFQVSNGGALTFAGVVTDITTGANEDLTVVANGTGTIVLDDTVTANGTITIVGAATDITTGANEDLTLQANGTGAIVLNDVITANGTLTFSGVTNDITTGNNEDLIVVASGTGVINLNDSITAGGNITFANGASRTLGVQTQAAGVAGNSLTVAGGSAGSGGAAAAGGDLVLQGGSAAGTGNANGGAITLTGGAGVGTGTQGLINLSTTAFTSAGVQSFGTAGTFAITAGNVDNYSSLPITASVTGVTVTVPDPSQSVIGRVIYIAARSGSADFTLRLNGTRTPIDIAMKQNSTATLIWNGTDWTAAGASSSTDLQSAYNNTLTSAGGAEIVLNAIGGAADGFTIRNNGATPIIGGLLEVQTSIGTNLFSVNNNSVEYASNGGAETAGGSATTFPANTWSAAPAGGTVARTVTSGQYVTGLAAATVTTTGANHGIRNQLTQSLTASTQHSVSFAAKLSAGTMTTLDVIYSRDGTDTSTTSCTTAQSATSTTWSKVTCLFTTPASGITSSNAIFIRQSDATGRTIYIDNLSITQNTATSNPANVQIGGGLFGGQPTVLTLDRFSAPPVANGNSTYFGSMYYDTTSGRIQCYEADGWGACGSAPDNIITLTPEYSGAVLNGTGVGTMTADFCANETSVLVVGSLCAVSEARNFYRWTSPQATQQTYSIYVTYKLPSTFKTFNDANTIRLTALSTHLTSAEAYITVFNKDAGTNDIISCGAATEINTSAINTWQTTSFSGDETACSFSGGDYVIFKIDMEAEDGESIYVENLDFVFTNN